MKTIMKYTLVLLAGLTAALSCAKIEGTDVVNSDNDEVAVGKQITINATLSDALTRVAYNLDESGDKPKLSLEWEDSDVLVVVSHSGESVEFTNPTIDESRKTASFSGTLPEGGEPYTVSVKHADSMLDAEQSQAEDRDLTHIEYAAMATGVTEADFASLNLEQTTGVLGLIAMLPSKVSASVEAVIFQTEHAIFNGSKTLTVKLNVPGAGDDNILYVYANVAAETIPAGTEMFIRFKTGADANDYYTRYQKFNSAADLTIGALNGLKLNCSHIDRYAGKDDKGTEAAPYLIADMYQLKAIDELSSSNKKYFKLIDDINLEGFDWTALNSDGTKVVDLDGNGKKIFHLNNTLFADFNGSANDLSIKEADVTGSGALIGIFANTIKTAASTLKNVDIMDSSVASTNNYVGGLVSEISAGATIEDCDVIGTNVDGVRAGGLVYFANSLVVVTNCSYSGATVKGSGQYIAGLIGSTSNKNSVIANCRVEDATIDATGQSDPRAGGLIGLLHNSVIVKGCSVGSSSKNVIVKTANPDESKVLNTGGFVGVHYGTITNNGDVRNKAYVTIQSANTKGQPLNLGGFVGYHRGTIEYSDAIVSMGDLKGQYIGGFSGRMLGQGSNATACKADNCTVTGTIRGNNYTGGFVGYVEDNGAPVTISNCTVLDQTNVTGQSAVGGFVGYSGIGLYTGNMTHANVTATGSNAGGFVGWLQSATMRQCAATGNLGETGSGSTMGGFAGISYSAAIQECYSSGSIETDASTVGGLIGSISATGDYSIENCFSTCSMIVSNQIIGGLIGAISGSSSVSISNCFSSSNINSSFRLGGLIANINTTSCRVEHCAAWNESISASKRTYNTNWSSGAVVGTAHPNCYLIDNYRNPNMSLLVWWVPASDYNHPNVEGTDHPLVIRNNEEPYTYTEATSTSMGAPYQFPYHGMVATGKTLSQLASTTLSWSSDVWNFTGLLPRLAWTLD